MDKVFYEEMKGNLDQLIQEEGIQGKKVFLFGHCNATESLADLLMERGFPVSGILDNNKEKCGKTYRGIGICLPEEVLKETGKEVVVCIVARAYGAMAAQLKRMGYKGSVRKLADYNSYAEYSLSRDTVARMMKRVERGTALLRQMTERHPGRFKILCPFRALGDIYFMMSYLPYFLKRKGIGRCVIGVIGKNCREVVSLFGDYETEVLCQKDMDELIQAALYGEDEYVFIPHQDRPYVVNLSKALYVKRIPLEKLYCCGVFGLPESTRPCRPLCLKPYPGLEEIEEGRTVILSPYAKSVPVLEPRIWEEIVGDFRSRGYTCLTNVAGDEKPLPGTGAVSPALSQMRSLAERAGTFIGLRSGLCDVVREAECRKAALYPDYHYSDTKWKAMEMYGMEGWENIGVGEGFQWKNPWS